MKFFGFLIILLIVACGDKARKVDVNTFEQIKPVPKIKPVDAQEQTQRVALLVPLTGEHAQLGQSLKNAAELSLFDNANDHFNLIIQDTKGTSEGAAKAVQEALAKKAQLILGPVFAYEVQSIKPYVFDKKIPIIAFSSDQKVKNKGMYVMGFSPRAQVKRIVSFAKAQGIDQLVALIPLNPYGLLVEEELKALEKSSETHLVKIVLYKGNGENLEEELNLLKEKSYNGLLLPVGGDDLKLLLSNLHAFGFDLSKAKLLGTGLWDSPETQAMIDLRDSWYACIDPSERSSFENKYRESYGVLPTRIATLAYDAVSLATTLSDTGLQNPYSVDQLTQPQGFWGMDGLFRLKPDGTIDRSLAILKITPQGPQVLDKSEKQF